MRTTSHNPEPAKCSDDDVIASRRRSSSEPQRPQNLGVLGAGHDGTTEYTPMATVAEEAPTRQAAIGTGRGRWRSATTPTKSSLRLAKAGQDVGGNVNDGKEYDSRVVNLLDVVGRAFSLAHAFLVSLGKLIVTGNRSGSIDSYYTYKRPEFAVCT